MNARVLEPPAEVPDLAMDEYGLDKASDMPAGETKTEMSVQKPLNEMPSIDHLDYGSSNQSNIEANALPKLELNKPEQELASSDSDIMMHQADRVAPNIDKVEQKVMAVSKPEPKKKAYDNFFLKLKDKVLNKKKINVEKIFEEMKDYHHVEQHKEKAVIKRKEIDDEISHKLWELELLEEGWYLLKRELEAKQIMLVQKEELIDKKIKEFQSLIERSKKADIRIAPHDKLFVLSNGTRISSVDELKDVIKSIDDNMFSQHVNAEKNDFSSWISHVFEDNDLADKLVSAKTKSEFIDVLDNLN